VVEGFAGEVEPGELAVSILPTGSTPGAESEGDPTSLPVRVAPFVDRYPGDPSSVIVTTLPTVIPVGDYRATARIGDREVVALFSLESWRERRDERVIVLPVVDANPRVLRLETHVTDALTGENLDSVARVEVLLGNSYVPVAFAGDLLSGRVLTFRVRVSGYLTQTVVVEPDRATGSLTLRFAVEKIGGNQ
jgi:hypothetical protein